MCHECEIREQRIVLRPRTGLNGRQEQVREAKKQRRRWKIRPRTNLNGGDLVRSTFWSLPLPLPLPLWPPLSLPLFLPFFPPLGTVSFFLLGNGEKRRILSQSGVILFGAFGRAFARVHCDLRRRFTFHRSWLKAGICCARRGSREGRSRCRRGWLSQSRAGGRKTTRWVTFIHVSEVSFVH